MADATQRTTNTFQKGLHTGMDKSQQSEQSYVDSLNGRVIFNEDGTYAWENAKGTKFALTVALNHGGITPPVPSGYTTPEYTIIAQCLINGQCVILMSNNWWSEIGVISQPQFGIFTYATIYNDYNDPQGPFGASAGIYAGQGRLQLKTLWNAKMKGLVEDEHTTRIYFWDDFNENRTLNIIPPSNQTTPPPAGQNIWTVPYPVYHSAHQINSMPDLFWGLIKYQYDISGSLPSGKYQYSYRYIGESGFVSPWSPLCAHLICSAQDRSNTDWNEYFMSDAGSVTTKGLQLEIKGLDQRFQQIEVAALLWETDLAPTSGVIFSKINIPQPPAGTPPSIAPSVIVQHTINEGVVITAEALIQRYFEIQSNKIGDITGDNYLHLANIEVYNEPQISSTQNITCQPILKKMLSDTKSIYNSNPDPVLNPIIAIPYTNAATQADTTTRNMFTGGSGVPYTEQYIVGTAGHEDYTNFKSTQWEHLYKSKMRGDTYPFALVLFDRKGQPSWAQHITDYTFPEQYNNNFTDSRLSGITTGNVGNVGDYRLTDTPFSVNGIPSPPYTSTDLILDNTQQGGNICPILQGISFSGIDLTDVLYDQYGDLQISGFAIVALPRLGTVVGQGLILNTIWATDTNGNDTHKTYPLLTGYNWYEQLVSGAGDPFTGLASDIQNLQVRQDSFTFECPDGFFDPTIFGTNLSSDTIVPVGIVAPYNIKEGDFTFTGPIVGLNVGVSADQFVGCAGDFATKQAYPHFLNKHYISIPNSFPPSYPSGSIDSFPTFNTQQNNNAFLGTPYSINSLYVGARNAPNFNQGFNYNEVGSIVTYYPIRNQVRYGGVNKVITGRAHPDTILFVSNTAPQTIPPTPNQGLQTASLRIKDWTGATNNYCHTPYYLANYTRQIGAYAITQSLLDNRVYNNIGHFIPINANTLGIANNGAGRYIFDNVEVYYGDTYVDFFCYDRIQPVYYNITPGTQTTPNCANQPNGYTDYAIVSAFCVESQYNHTMRSGITAPRYGTEPMNTYCNPGPTTTNPDGIWYFSDTLKQDEQFQVQADLNAANTANQYNSLQSCFGVVNNDFPMREIYSYVKVYGECYDSFRQFPTNQYQDAMGLYGEITSINYMGGYNSLYCLQRYGFSRVLFNERTGIAAGGGDLLTAIANGYQGHQYLSIKDGCQHLYSVVNTGKALWWIDAEGGKQSRFAQNGVECVSDDHDYHDQITAWTRNYWNVIDPAHLLVPLGAPIRYYDNPAYMGGIISIYDYKNDSIYTTFTKTLQSVVGNSIIVNGVTTKSKSYIETTDVQPQTIEFSNKLSQYVSRHGFYPNMYLDLKQSFFSPRPIATGQIAPIIDQNDEGIRGQIYGVNQPSYLRFVTNPQPFAAKVFDNARLGVDTENGANRISLVNLTTPITPLQSVVLNNPVADYRPRYLEGFLLYPMMALTGREDRMRGTYLIQEYQIDNDGIDTIVRLTGQETKYRISYQR